ncbi:MULTISPECIES: vancomycin high temperature exclusion protein [unclassified Vibrio]|uniref:ElyC/SanA/YdcF family protein n=1 Tax=Vibrio sp. HB236076 TaxID=3232307 RepID=A0AB39HCQ5_9VIBR|nr:ElyC/SanA/YdcF family protein [Vibrio sp. HB161653]MDP5253583.1 ElyC/SanA/YdcF family protein [Vibrio sp. HB161653]
MTDVRRILLRCCYCVIGVLLVVCLTIILIDRWISWQTNARIYHHIDQVPHYDVAVVLGTSKYIGRTLNVYYHERIQSAIALYRAGKIEEFLLSGDNAHRSYNEPWTMKRDLLKAGIDDSHIHLDYAGFRTLDSIVRAKKVFDSRRFLIISQNFHCQRALFIAKANDIDAHCYAVKGDKEGLSWSLRIREILARSKAFLDLYIIHTQPKFLGPKEPIRPSSTALPLSKDENIDSIAP